jgi:hypothetical protein
MRLAVLGMEGWATELPSACSAAVNEVTVWNRTPHKADDLVARGARAGATPAAAAEETEATLTSLADDAGRVLDRRYTRALRPAGGGLRRAHRRGASCLRRRGRKSGDHAQVALQLPAHVRNRHPSRDRGNGSGRRALRRAHPRLPRGPAARRPALRNRLDDIVSGDHDGWFSTTLGAKDVRLAENLALSHGVLLPLADAVKRRFEEAAAQGWADADIGAVDLLRG